MSKKAIYLIVAIVVLIILVILVWFFWLRDSGTKIGLPTGKEYRILYSRYSNDIIINSTTGKECKNFNLHENLAGGIVKGDGQENKILGMEGYPMGRLSSQKYDNYFYISAEESPVSEINIPGLPENISSAISNYSMFNLNIKSQNLWQADFNQEKSEKIKSYNDNKFSSMVAASPDNKYLVYTMTDHQENELSITSTLDPFLSDSDLIVKNLKTGKEQTVISQNYNRQLFDSLSDFSKSGEAFYTIVREGDSFKFVKIDLETGQLKDFNQTFDNSKISWNEFFSTETNFQQARFYVSPNEDRILAFRNQGGGAGQDYCVPLMTHKLWQINLEDSSYALIEEENTMIVQLSWHPGGESFASAENTAGGCYPDYMDTMIFKMDRNGKNKDRLFFQEKSRINSLGWSPDGKEIGFSIYGSDFVGWLKTIDPNSKAVKNIISTQETEGSINKEQPVVLIFAGWVAPK